MPSNEYGALALGGSFGIRRFASMPQDDGFRERGDSQDDGFRKRGTQRYFSIISSVKSFHSALVLLISTSFHLRVFPFI